ncbi:MAG: hypothetical protein B6I18_05215 [Bacteroidetes bacterium 4572_112]|nr:MAG: hypothetical protein B6I18_05215 [Bacteroidetes bacterium 4572_112]
MNNKLIAFFILTLIAHFNKAYAIIDFNENCKKSFEYTIALDHVKSIEYLSKEIAANPNNSAISYIKTYEAFLNYITNGNQKSLDDFDDIKEIAIDNISDESDDNPYKLYLLADIYLQESIISSLRKSYISAIYQYKKSYGIINDNIEKFPNFIPNYKTHGINQVAIGSIPKNYGWALNMLGISGDVSEGFINLEKSVSYTKDNDEYNYLFIESILVYTFLYDNFSNQSIKNKILEDAYNNDDFVEKYKNNLMYIFARTSYFLHNKQNDKAIKSLEIVKTNPTRVSNDFCFLNYQYGLCLIYKLDFSSSKYFTTYIKNYPANNYKAASHQKIAWAKLLSDNLNRYKAEMVIIKDVEAGFYDSDKQAKKEANSEDIPNVHLLKSRMLFDGGYYDKAIKELQNGQNLNNYTSDRNKIEYIYRLGRIYDESDHFDNAEKYYLQTIEKARDKKYFYAAKSALQLGYRYEEMGKLDKAKEMYELILKLDFDEYQNGITQKAKAGLSRIKN